jgi:hypothetical protein
LRKNGGYIRQASPIGIVLQKYLFALYLRTENLKFKTMKKLLLLTLTSVLLTGCFPATKNLEKKYGYTIEPGNELLDAGMIYTKEKTADGQFRYRTFYNETRQMTLERYYKDADFQVAHGLSRSWSDDGQLWQEGNYEDGNKQGEWTEYSLFADPDKNKKNVGLYKKGVKHRMWRTTNREGKIIQEEFYQNGTVMFNNTALNDSTVVGAGGRIMPEYGCQKVKHLQDTICGEASLQYFLSSEVRYPDFARYNNIMGTAYALFTINKQGEIEDVYIVNGLCNDIKKEVIRVVSVMNLWRPGKVGEVPATVRFTLPIRFRLY